eukprot:gnl/TRDRNA2_/TRDRNA2_177906_c5_seq1.p1 gnl/TRDRNA2_/TRDRNA2_177906_c5~~gnl/TRDRNA2_/TRDRNA2_177906_c5_seq1.p1  ORF type:complete len:491 (+),score=154.88 gnl/TRDRNA2_/TRDRNA2_177906_c5_seq1:84-1556(+)
MAKLMIIALVTLMGLSSSVHPPVGASPKTFGDLRASVLHAVEKANKTTSSPDLKNCWQKRQASLIQRVNMSNPGAGVKDIDDFKPYKTVEKDGYSKVGCVKDYMFYHGDKFGANKHDYELKDIAGVSIVHYHAHVPKEDRAPEGISPRECFEFCRTVPDMLFFGLINGRDCYCSPFYNMMAGDSSECDKTCEGEPTLMCGGKKKSSIFSMHFCDSTSEDLSTAASKAKDLAGEIAPKVEKANTLSEKMNDSGEKNQKTFGKAGDLAAGDLMQAAKVYAGDVEKAAAASDKIKDKLKSLSDDAAKIEDFTKPAEVTKAERLMEDIEETVAEAVVSLKAIEEVLATIQPGPVSEGAADQYLPLMYFVEKEFQDVPQTCSGEIVDKPIGGLSMDGCASACDAQVHDCKGFAYFDTGAEEDRLCFLFSSFKSAVYYTGCDKKTMLLQHFKKVKGADEVTCAAKLTEYEGQDLSVDKSGKCKFCLKKLTKADRCY